jgi:FeS assembly SUF system protein
MDLSQKRRQVIEILKTIFDPEIPVNIWDLGLIYAVDCTPENVVTVIYTLTSPNCPAIDILPEQMQIAIESLPELEEVNLKLVWDPTWSKSMMSDEAKLELGMF